jgi:hypothetical protein
LAVAAVVIENSFVIGLPFAAPLKTMLYVVDGLNGAVPTKTISFFELVYSYHLNY